MKPLARSVLLALFCLLRPATAEGAPLAYPANLHVVSSLAAYQAEVRADPSRRMVDLARAVPGLAVDLRYATDQNFTGEALYDSPRALGRAGVAAGLRGAVAELAAQGLGLKVYDAYRPYSVTCRMWAEHPAERPFLAPPTLASNHNRGAAVDVTLIDLRTGRELPMPTAFDAVTRAAYHGYADLPPERIAHRELLAAVMERHGFRRFELEWWHYGLRGAEGYSVLDLPISVLANAAP